jgi:hypothetical protein
MAKTSYRLGAVATASKTHNLTHEVKKSGKAVATKRMRVVIELEVTHPAKFDRAGFNQFVVDRVAAWTGPGAEGSQKVIYLTTEELDV